MTDPDPRVELQLLGIVLVSVVRVQWDLVMLHLRHYLSPISIDRRAREVRATYSLFERIPLLQRQRVRLRDDWDNVDHLRQLLQHDDVNLVGQRMSTVEHAARVLMRDMC